METSESVVVHSVPSCIVCSASGCLLVPACIKLARSGLSAENFLNQHHVYDVLAFDKQSRADRFVCGGCYGLVVDCDEWSFAFNEGIECLKQKTLTCLPSGSAAAISDGIVLSSETTQDYVLTGIGAQPSHGQSPEDHDPSVGEDCPADPILLVAGVLKEPDAHSDDGCDVDVLGNQVVEDEPSTPEEPPASADQLSPSQDLKGPPSIGPTQSASNPTDPPKKKLKIYTKPRATRKVCPVCGEDPPLGTYAHHYRSVHPDEPFRKRVFAEFLHCDQCPYRTRMKRLLVQHQTVHGILATGKCRDCPECGVRFRSQPSLDGHMVKVHGKEKSIACDQCDKRFPGHLHLKQHVFIMHPSDFSTRVCAECGKDVPINRYRRHMARVHRLKRKPYPCPHCDLVRLSAAGRRQHLFTEHNIGKGKKVYERECPQCGKKFKKDFDLHMYKKHGVVGGVLANYRCEHCEEQSLTRKSFEEHMKLHFW